MEWSKMKNIIILVLLLVNGFLLVLVGARRSEARHYEQTALLQAVQALENSGIQVELANLADADGLTPLAIERDVEMEARMISGLLGETAAGDDRGGGLYLYRGQRGEASLRPGGELSAAMEDDPRWHTDNPAEHAAGLLRQMGIDAELAQTAAEENETRVVFRQLWNGVPLFSCQAEFVYRAGRLERVRGSLLCAGSAAAETGAVLTLPTALMQFLDYVLDSGDVCSSIRSMRPGYRASQSFSGETRLTAVWLISSNTASYYLDASTGALTRLTE